MGFLAGMFWVIGLSGLLGLCYYLWPADKRSFKTVVTTGIVIGAIVGIASVISRALPITRTETVIKKVQIKRVKPPEPPKVVYKDRIVYQVPGKELDPIPADDVCKGKRPAEILKLDLSSKGEGDDKTTNTWIVFRPIGSKIKITCYVSGDLTGGFWNVGDIVMLANGSAQ